MINQDYIKRLKNQVQYQQDGLDNTLKVDINKIDYKARLYLLDKMYREIKTCKNTEDLINAAIPALKKDLKKVRAATGYNGDNIKYLQELFYNALYWATEPKKQFLDRVESFTIALNTIYEIYKYNITLYIIDEKNDIKRVDNNV